MKIASPGDVPVPRLKAGGQIPKARIRRILVRTTNWVGDAIMTLPALETLKTNFPQSYISVLGRPWVLPLLESHPAVDQVIPHTRKGGGLSQITGLIQGAREIRKGGFDLAVIFQNAFEAALLCYLGGPPYRVGYNTEGRGIFLTHRVKRSQEVLRVHQVEYYLAMLRALGWEAQARNPVLHVSPEDTNRTHELLDSINIDRSAFLLGLGPGAVYGGAKRWPPERFARIGDWASENWGARVLVMGSGMEQDICKRLCRLMTHEPVNLCGRTSLGEAMGLISRCHMFVSNDSGLMHMAAALRIPTVAVFGSTDPVATGPRGANVRVVRHETACAPCLKTECPTDFRCMLSIDPEEVWQVMEDLKECMS